MASSLLDQLQAALPVEPRRLTVNLDDKRTGLVVVDEVNGFCTPGMGNLAPRAPNAQVEAMVARTVQLAREFTRRGCPVLAFLDTHEADRPEPPYPPHCIRGTGEEKLVEALSWMQSAPHVTLVEKDCINGYVGAILVDPVLHSKHPSGVSTRPSGVSTTPSGASATPSDEHARESTQSGRVPVGENRLVQWVKEHGLNKLLVVGICTDICVMDFVLTALSARNHRVLGDISDIIVCASACATYDLPAVETQQMGLPSTSAHPQMETHHLGLYFMQSRGAIIAEEVILQ